ncbi:GNAT family N-acetyltransferase [Demequina sp. NBRC 110057]|uniref:GNAT family N-acetyltransferase n=1 Tax=Demequina sp. NBRC 110057 TaxID=1570346 RepID=UPI00190F06D8|nr:GNAT family N-acetyltransferase [Demequina sp. NBRC 110057]
MIATVSATDRLTLHRPTSSDLGDLHDLMSDPAVWTHYPSLVHRDLETTEATLERWEDSWHAHGLGVWVARDHEGGFVGYGGCDVRRDAFWNVGYRLRPEHQGRGYATELARAGIAAARRLRPEIPVVAYLLEVNAASAAVARRAGLVEVHRAPDAGNPDRSAVRLVFADRNLDRPTLTKVLA